MRNICFIAMALTLSGCVSAQVARSAGDNHVITIETPDPMNTWVQRATFDQADEVCPNGWEQVSEQTTPNGRMWDGTPLFTFEREVRCL